MMNILTKQDKANTVAERWKQTYYNYNYSYHDKEWLRIKNNDSEAAYNKLLNLGDTPSPTDIDAIIGNSTWTSLTCNCCEQEVDTVVQFKGVAHDEYYGDTELCKSCIIKIYDLITIGL